MFGGAAGGAAGTADLAAGGLLIGFRVFSGALAGDAHINARGGPGRPGVTAYDLALQKNHDFFNHLKYAGCCGRGVCSKSKPS